MHNLMASSNKGGVDSTQFKAKKTVFRESHKSEGGQQVQAVMAGWKCSTYQYLGSMQMKVCDNPAGLCVCVCVLSSLSVARANRLTNDKASALATG